MLATTEALTINRVHARAHREAARLEIREPKDSNVVVKVETKTFYKVVRPAKTVKVQQAAQSSVVVAAAPVHVEAVASSAAPAPAPSQKAADPEPTPAVEAAKTTGSSGSSSSSGQAAAVSGGKRGILYAGERAEWVDALSKGKCSWSYNWSSKKSAKATSGLEFVPMCWSKSKCEGSWDADVASAIASGSKAVLSFNEADVGEQAARSPAEAAAEHKALFSGLKGKVQISSPSVTSTLGNDNMGLNWLKQFFSACGGDCPVDFCAVHFYGNPGDEQYLYDHLKNAHDVCGGKDIWLTEFGLNTGDLAAHATFMNNVIPKLESSEFSYVKRYAYFMASTDKISPLVTDGGVTDVGIKYATGF